MVPARTPAQDRCFHRDAVPYPDASCPATQSAEEVAANAEAALPAEPSAGEAGACVLAVRFPDGSRVERRFPPDTPLAAVRHLCTARQAEAARGRAFWLSTHMPGIVILDKFHLACRTPLKPLVLDTWPR